MTFSAWLVPGRPPELGLSETLAKTLRTPTSKGGMRRSLRSDPSGPQVGLCPVQRLSPTTPPSRGSKATRWRGIGSAMGRRRGCNPSGRSRRLHVPMGGRKPDESALVAGGSARSLAARRRRRVSRPARTRAWSCRQSRLPCNPRAHALAMSDEHAVPSERRSRRRPSPGARTRRHQPARK